ncbi:MAG: hypothetical protein ACT4PW_06985 [Acidimicrobiia bacterium]
MAADRAPLPVAGDVHEWLSFEDPDESRTWVFDATFLVSPWTCIFGRGCEGVLSEPAPERGEGCCSYGAHFTDEDDRDDTAQRAARLTDGQWQFKGIARRRGGPFKTRGGTHMTRLHDGACIFLNRPGFAGGTGCALHRAALERGERPLDWKPDVCWQLPLRRTDEVDTYGHVTSTVREWKRRDWGPGGSEFHWWCTESNGDRGLATAFVGHRPVFSALRDELVEMVGERPYLMLARLLRQRGTETVVAHPGLKSKR